MNSTNKEGKSLIHLIVESKKILKKEEKLKRALNEGFCFNIKDNKDFYPIDYAYLNEEKEIMNILKNMYYKEGLFFKINSKYDFNRDSDILYKESISDSYKYQKCDDLFELVSDQFEYARDKTYKVCLDSESYPYNVSLIRGNIYYLKALMNTFIMQIIENIRDKTYIVASMVMKEKFKEYKFNSLNEAEIKFKEIFTKKTNNDWDIVKKDKLKFKVDYKKYYFFNYNFEEENYIYDYLKITINNLYIKKFIKYNGNDKVRDFVYDLTREIYNNRFSNDNNKKKLEKKNVEDNTREIIKNYKEKAIKDSIIILFQIEAIIKESSKNNTLEKYNKKLSYLINSYKELIPFSIYENDTNILKTQKEINEEIGRLTTYYYIENVLKIFLAAIKNLDEMHPLDYIINSLGCDIIVLQEGIEKNFILKFLLNGGANKIKNIFKIKKSKNEINFNPNNFKNKYILCHGTKTENILGILSQGLKISPVQANFQGQSYGEGIYLSDLFDLSIQYSKIDNIIDKKKNNYLLLVEAALGEFKKDYNSKNGKIDFKEVYLTEDGNGILTSSNLIGEIIVVKDEMNVRVKYIVEV